MEYGLKKDSDGTDAHAYTNYLFLLAYLLFLTSLFIIFNNQFYWLSLHCTIIK